MENICRTCLKVAENLQYLFNDTELPYKIKTISTIQVSATDNLPSRVCEQCVRNIHLLFDFRSIIIRSNSILIKRASATNEQFNNSGLVKKAPPDEVKIESDSSDTEVTVKVADDDLNSPKTELGSDEIKIEDGCSSDVEISISKDRDIIESSCSDEEVAISKDLDIVKINSDKLSKENDTTTIVEVPSILKKRAYVCQKCTFRCYDYKQWRNHKYTHTECIKSICNVCGKSVRADNLKKHMLTHTDSSVKCKECGKVLKYSSLRGHQMIHKDVSLQCNICGKVYTHRTGYRQHMSRHRRGNAKTIKCSVCNKLFNENSLLKKHMRSHTGERPYPCEYCKKNFSSSFALKTHVRKHTNERPYACQFCPAAYPQNVSLRTHLKSKHSTETTAAHS